MIVWFIALVIVLLLVREAFLFYTWIVDLRKAREGFRERFERPTSRVVR